MGETPVSRPTAVPGPGTRLPGEFFAYSSTSSSVNTAPATAPAVTPSPCTMSPRLADESLSLPM